MDAVEDYARKWIKREKEDIDSLSERLKAVRSLIVKRLIPLNRSMSANSTSVFKDPDVAKTLSTIYDKYVCTGRQSPKQHCFCLQNVLLSMFIIKGRSRK